MKVEGQLVPPGDWEALSNALNLLARDPERRRTPRQQPPSRGCGRDFSMEGGLDRADSASPQDDGKPSERTGAGVTDQRPSTPPQATNHPLPRATAPWRAC